MPAQLVHYGIGDVRCPGQQNDSTDDRGEPLIDHGWYVVVFDSLGLPVCGTVRP